jgi:O-antigen ligase
MITTLSAILFLSIFFLAFKRPMICFGLILHMHITKSFPLLDFKNPAYNYINENDPIMGVLLIVLCFIIIILISITKGAYRKYKLDFIDFFLICLSILVTISILVSNNFMASFEYWLRYLLVGIPYFFVLKFYLSGIKNKRKAIEELLITILVLGVVSAVIAFYLHSIAKYPWIRLTLPGVFPIPFSVLISESIIILTFLSYGKKRVLFRNKKKFLVFPVLGFLLLILFWANTRGPVLAMILSGMVLFFLFSKIRIKPKTIFRVILGGTVLVSLVLITLDVEKTFMRFVDFSHKHSSTHLTRFRSYYESLNIFIENPLGIGLGTFQEYYAQVDDSYVNPYPHNLFLEFITSFGIFGIILSILLILILIKEYGFLKNNEEKLKKNIMFMLVVFLVLVSFFETQVSYTLSLHKSWYVYLAVYSILRYEIKYNSVQ